MPSHSTVIHTVSVSYLERKHPHIDKLYACKEIESVLRESAKSKVELVVDKTISQAYCTDSHFRVFGLANFLASRDDRP